MKIDFYVLEHDSAQKSLFFGCQLIEKAYHNNEHVYVHTHSREQAERMDALLWTYKEDSFVPHNLYAPQDDCAPAIQIGYGEKPENHADILLNLHQSAPLFYAQFKQVIEIVYTDPLIQQQARARYKYYRDEGHEITTHKLKAAEL